MWVMVSVCHSLLLTYFPLLRLPMGHSPFRGVCALARVAHGAQSLQGCLCSGTGCLQATVSSGVSLLWCVSSMVHSLFRGVTAPA